MANKQVYIAANLAFVAVYILIRYLAVKRGERAWRGRVRDHEELWSWEKNAFFTACALVTWKGLRRRSTDQFLQQSFFYCKVIVLLTTCVLDYRLGAWYILLWWVLTSVVPQSMPDMTASGGVTQLTHHMLVDAMGQPGDVATLVYCYTEHHAESITLAQAFQQVAARFGSDKLRFCCFDVCFWPGSATRDLKISASTFSNQLPSVVMFQGGREVTRIPTIQEAEDFILKRAAFSQKDIIRRFDLEARSRVAKASQDSKSSKKTR